MKRGLLEGLRRRSSVVKLGFIWKLSLKNWQRTKGEKGGGYKDKVKGRKSAPEVLIPACQAESSVGIACQCCCASPGGCEKEGICPARPLTEHGGVSSLAQLLTQEVESPLCLSLCRSQSLFPAMEQTHDCYCSGIAS